MRGKASVRRTQDETQRITPAYAGKSNTSTMMWCSHWDHPRVCGEKREIVSYYHEGEGSPPRMRGKAVGGIKSGRALGITPAHAGKRWTRRKAGKSLRDHPRACGEKSAVVYAVPRALGSPPRMRGKDKKDPVAPCLLRLLYCVFLQFAIDLLDQSAIRQSAVGHPHARHLVHLSFLRA